MENRHERNSFDFNLKIVALLANTVLAIPSHLFPWYLSVLNGAVAILIIIALNKEYGPREVKCTCSNTEEVLETAAFLVRDYRDIPDHELSEQAFKLKKQVEKYLPKHKVLS